MKTQYRNLPTNNPIFCDAHTHRLFNILQFKKKQSCGVFIYFTVSVFHQNITLASKLTTPPIVTFKGWLLLEICEYQTTRVYHLCGSFKCLPGDNLVKRGIMSFVKNGEPVYISLERATPWCRRLKTGRRQTPPERR